MPARLRFGIMCKGLVFQSWEAQCLRELLQVADPALIIVDDGAEHQATTAQPAQRGFMQKLASLRKPEMAWTLFQRWFVNPKSAAMKSIDLAEELGQVPTISCRTIDKGKFSRYLQSDDIECIRSHQLDFVIRFAFGIVRGEVLDVPRYGVWSFHHDDIENYRGGPPCFWEIVRQDPVTGATLQRINDRLDGGVVLRRGWFRTASTSYRLNRDNVYLGSTEWPAQVCRDISDGNLDYIEAAPTRSTAPIDYRPSRWQLLRFVAGCALRYTKSHLLKLTRADEWAVGVADDSVAASLEVDVTRNVRWFESTGRRSQYIADPVPLSGENGTVLVEAFDYRDGRGRLQAYDVATGKPAELPVPECNVHLSYPFTFRFENDTYCLPEAAASQQLQMWKRSDDGNWLPHRVIIDLPVLDPTLFQHDGRWWLFGTILGDHPDVKLRLWHAESPFDGWVEHPQSPVKCDVRSSRPAGPLFCVSGKIYRPAQNCARTYGGSITINHVTELSETRFQEHVVKELLPDPNSPWPDGMHTIASLGEKTVIDGKRHVFIASAASQEFRKRLRRMRDRVFQRSSHTSAGL